MYGTIQTRLRHSILAFLFFWFHLLFFRQHRSPIPLFLPLCDPWLRASSFRYASLSVSFYSQAIGLGGLAAFFEHAGARSKPLGRCEKRFEVDDKRDLDIEWLAHAPKRIRYCVQDTAANTPPEATTTTRNRHYDDNTSSYHQENQRSRSGNGERISRATNSKMKRRSEEGK